MLNICCQTSKEVCHERESGGVTLGVVGAVAVSRGKLDIKPFATELLSRGMDMKDAVLAKMEGVKEDMEDMVAEARVAAEERRENKA